MKKLGAWLKAARVRNGYTLRDIERKSRGAISNAYVCQVEQGEKEITPGKLRVLCRVLRVDYVKALHVASYLTKKDFVLARRKPFSWDEVT